jgi:hypothetical protein
MTLVDLATEVDRLSAEVDRLRNRTGDYSEATS